MEDQVEALKSLHTSLIDSRNGYDKAVKDAKGEGETPVFREMLATHARDADEIAACLRSRGAQPDDSGSFMSTVHRTIMDVRSLFGGLDESVLPGLIDGEQRTLGAYDDALKYFSANDAEFAILTAQRTALANKIHNLEVRKETASH